MGEAGPCLCAIYPTCSTRDPSMGVATVWGFAVVGVDAVPVRVEAHARSGLPGVTIVGLPGAAVREARERIRSGAASSGLPLPTRRITINLSPGDIPKDGPGFDLPVALATLAACGTVPVDSVRGIGAVGEVSLEGAVRPTRGMVSVAEAASSLGVKMLIAPVECLPAASEVSTVPVVGVRSLGEAVAVVKDAGRLARVTERGRRWLSTRSSGEGLVRPGVDLSEVVGHHHAKRALEIVAAGNHHLLMVGPPGVGKTMLAQRLVTILPPLTRLEAIEATRVWHAAGLRDPRTGLASERPFRAPHHTASRAAVVGGGMPLRPGEVSLAHHGVLFLDELPEFSRDILESLRQPLEEGRVMLSRRAGTSIFPARFTLAAAMNPCECGYLGHPRRTCRCSGAALARYRARISGPLLDRIDVLVEVPALTPSALDQPAGGEPSAVVRERILAAREFAHERVRKDEGAPSSGLEGRQNLASDARALLRRALVGDALSGRAYARVLRLARTIADLDQTVTVQAAHVAEAISLHLDYRRVGLG